jgi:DNA-directed RNA polymerase subunit M/transcription elongation factor TFIIS
MFECAAAQASGGNLALYALYLEEFATMAESNPELPPTTILQRALQPLPPPQPLQLQQPLQQPTERQSSLPQTTQVSQVSQVTQVMSQAPDGDGVHVVTQAQISNNVHAVTQAPNLNGPSSISTSNATNNKEPDRLTCPMCRSKNESVMPFEKQRRSADEPAHQYAQCLNDDCRHVWLVSS